MKTYRIENTDLTVSRIAYGCAEIAPRAVPITTELCAHASRLVHTALEQGITLFDLAAMYGAGKAETVFGEILRQSPGLRHRIVLQTKFGAIFTPEPKREGDAPFQFDCTRASIMASLEASLSRLGTDCVDIALIHWPDLLSRPEEIASAFDELHRSGKVRYFGVSNHTASQIELLRRYVRQPIVINQIQLGLAESYPIASGLEQLRHWNMRMPLGSPTFSNVVDYCRSNDIRIQAYSPLRGLRRHKLIDPPEDASPDVKEAARLLAEVAGSKNTAPTTVGLAWLLQHPADFIAVIGGKNPQHLSQNCLADTVALSRDEWYRLFFAGCRVQAQT